MNIQLNKVVPAPLEEVEFSQNSIWNSTFMLEKGEKVLLNATSGKGKTTFAFLLAGLRKDYSGEITFDGQNSKNFSLEEWAIMRAQKLSFVFQDLQLFGELTVAENLQLKNQLTSTFTEEEIKAMVNQLGIGDKWQSTSNTLSMGQQQRVAIIRALCQPFDWLIMDEPFSHLDENNILLAKELIEQVVAKQNAGLVMTALGKSEVFKFTKELFL
ncbi:MAG TPA: ATP-binding cassette domain-containing protein [Brumimicrobium sp.]|nr:ATP-binding cassette domain-containing protein [Brumimicrobium sp.]